MTTESKQPEGSISEAFEQSGEAAPMEGAPVGSNVGPGEQPEPQAAEAPKPEPIKIGSKVFNNEAEAQAYVQQLEHEKLQSDAYRQALEHVQSQQQPRQPQVEAEPEDLDGKFYESPTKFIQEQAQKVRETVTKEIEEKFEKQKAVERMWDDFYSKNQDLQGEDDLVNLVMTQNWDSVAHMKDRNKALDIVAQKTRERLHKIRDKFVPQQELANRPSEASRGSAAPPPVRPGVDDEPVLDFASQINNTQKGKYGIY